LDATDGGVKVSDRIIFSTPPLFLFNPCPVKSPQFVTPLPPAKNIMIGVRMDKWLWAARFFKTRSLAAHACDLGRIEINGQQAKPSREVRAGNQLRVKNTSGDFLVEVLGVSDIRGPAAIAQSLYRESDESRETRLKAAEERKAMMAFGGMTEAKPSKRDRREIDRLRGRTR
jgi:ribosome-associated heat shock protein Hsp15